MAESRRASTAGHLPKQGGDTTPGPPPELPRQRRGTTPQMRGRYPDYDVLAEADHWDAVTRRMVLERIAEVPPVRFFSEPEARTLRAFCDVVTGQDLDPRIPVLEMVDAKLHAGRLDGFRHHDMPPDPETWREVAANLDRSACERGCEQGFAAAGSETQHEIVQRFSTGELDWTLPVSKAWGVVMRAALSAFYSHPWAWSEIGFGGPAYPRGYARLGAGQREVWEAPPEFSADPVADVHEQGLE
ncbi:MAG TPA: gluconate 2-dehydrogenase subunit 3 family protein [Solirubrobacteraceae bacterium]|nr:gluconate 2-dehydrogenase subunit 3 family protein [Solirubrobacteraceae bacterium]